MEQQFNQTNPISNSIPQKSKKDVVIWWSISGGMIFLGFLLTLLERLRIIYLSYGAELLFIGVLIFGGLIVGLIALVKTYIFLQHKGKMILLGFVSVVILIIGGIYFLYQQAQSIESERHQNALQEFNRKFDDLNEKLKRNEPGAQEEMDKLMEQYYGRPVQ